MKKLLLLLCLFPLFSKAQELVLPIDSTTNKVSYADVKQAPGLTKDDLYVRGREWFAKTFVSSQAVIQMDDKAAGKIIGKGTRIGYRTGLFDIPKFTLFYTVSLTVKDGRYRYELSDIYYQNDPSKYVPDPAKAPIDEWVTDPKYKNKKGEYKGSVKKELTAVSELAKDLLTSLTNALAAQPTGVKAKDDF